MEEKETYNQLQCEKCKIGLIPVYNKNNKKLQLYCSCCDDAWTFPITLNLDKGIKIYEKRTKEG